MKILGTTKAKKTKTSWEGLVEDVKVRILIFGVVVDFEFGEQSGNCGLKINISESYYSSNFKVLIFK